MRSTSGFWVMAALALTAAPAAHADGGEEQLRLGPPRAAVATESDSPADIGQFGDPFAEPTVAGQFTGARCITDRNNVSVCKPAAGSVTVLASGKVLYWNALEGTENIQASIVIEGGRAIQNDQTRLLDLSTNPFTWSQPEPVDAGANPDGYSNPLIPGGNDDPGNDGALFCSDLTFLPDGRVLAAGGTSYYFDPELGDTGLGVVELEGIRSARIYDPATNTWSQTGSMNVGRWYPSLVTLPDGKVLAASGVEKLVKPLYPDRPERSGRNVTQTETYDPETGAWTDNGAAAERSLPLYPRLHLLPNGDVFYNAAGQSFNPFGQAFDEPLWNVAASYDPDEGRWTDLGVPGLQQDATGDDAGDAIGDLMRLGIPGGGRRATIPGFRGSTFSVMLPLQPEADGSYRRAEFLTAGGVLNPPSPGSYFATSDSRITTIDTGAGNAMTTRATGDLNRPRWYPTGVLLPTGEVIAFSGADRDEVASPGLELPVKQAEMFDPETEAWKPLAEANRPRTYHNTAALLPDGRVLVGGHAPITTLYLRHLTVPGGFAPNDGKDPTFELYSPPYLFRGERPRILSASDAGYGETLELEVDRPADEIESVVLVRNPSTTHVVDPDQRSVVLRVLRRDRNRLELAMPPDGAVAPPGPYMLFANRRTPDGPVPSVAEQVLLSP